jgi:diguanylate cyclase (GGDEF)-like protein/PAS domain S-box-containing protein
VSASTLEQLGEARLQAQYDGIPVPCFTWRREAGTFVLDRVNRAAHASSLVDTGAVPGTPVTRFFAGRPDLQDTLEACLAARATLRREVVLEDDEGRTRTYDATFVHVPPDSVMVHVDDVTRERETQERLRAVIATLPSGLVSFAADGTVIDANPAACRIFGLSRQAMEQDPDWWRKLDVEHPHTPPGEPHTWPAAQALKGETVRDVPAVLTRPDGTVAELSTSYEPLRVGPEGRVQGLVLSVLDETERRRLEQRLADQAHHDSLTGLPNRRLFLERLEQMLARPRRGRAAVFVVALDRFRAVNDTHGHAAGDDLLVEVARRLEGVVRAEPLARFGGDEFAVFGEFEDERAAVELGRWLSAVLKRPFGARVPLTTSIGIAVEDAERCAAMELVQRADAAMQRVKSRGGATLELYDRAMAGRLRDQLRLEADLWRAIEHDELRLHYQRIQSVADPDRVVAVEALVRWQHPEEGLLAPGRFLPVAERHGRLMSAIGDWVLRQACAEARLWPEDVRVSVNIAARELGEPGFAQRIAATLERADVTPDRISLEITETTLMEGGDAAIAGLEALTALGVHVTLDDFGTGYSSLTRLAQLPLSGIKLDRGFVAGAEGERGRRIIEAALSIGRAAALPVVAEGVETDAQLALLRACGCPLVQGFLLGRPAPPEQVAASLN